MAERKLTSKQEAFVQEYLVDLNATQAAIRAGYSEHTAHATGHENLKKPEIEAAIAEAKEKRANRVELTADMVLEGLLKEAKLYDEGATHGARVTAWSQLGKHLSMFIEKQEVTIKGDIADQILEARQRAKDAKA